MVLLKRNNIGLITTINILFSLFPLSIIFGNFLINLNLILFCLAGIFYLKFKIISIKFDFSLKIIFLFFLALICSTLINFLTNDEYNDINTLIKSIFFLRFFLLLTIIYYLNKYNILNFQYFLTSVTFLLTIISLDIIFQYTLGFNTIGLINHDPRHYSGFFGNELIAGGYIQSFSFFPIFFINFLFEKKMLKSLLTIFLIVILGLSLIFAGNRMSLIIFLFGLLLALIVNKELIKNIIAGTIILLILFTAIISFNSEIKAHYTGLYKIDFYENSIMAKEVYNYSFLNNIKNIFIVKIKNLDKKSKANLQNKIRATSDHSKLLLTAIDTWRFNKIFGNGLKSFRINCHKLVPPEFNLGQKSLPNTKNRLCSTHPHNYYFEILSEMGILGISIVIIICLSFLFFVIKNFNLFRSNQLDNMIFRSSTLHLFLATFPFRSTGSIFTTTNAIYLILFAALMLSSKQSLLSAKSFIK